MSRIKIQKYQQEKKQTIQFDICREIRNMYTGTNMLICKFDKCSTVLKIWLFRSYCISQNIWYWSMVKIY